VVEPPRKTIDELLREARSRLDRVPPSNLRAEQEAGALVIDTRSGDERRRHGIIPGSIHIPRSVLEWRVDPDADPAFRNPHVQGLDQRLLLVCADGYSSSLAAATLRDLGFARATDLDGGFTAWKELGLPVGTAPVNPPDIAGTGGPD
jgi:rhodanese-related sulfurtransferase